MNTTSETAALPSSAQSLRLGLDADVHQVTAVAQEVPISLQFQGFPYVVLMGSPQDLDDLAVGFSITDGICHPEEIVSISSRPEGPAIVLNVQLAPDAFARFLYRRRERSGRSYTSCGVCGIRELNDLPRLQATSAGPVSRDAIRRALRELPDHQPLNRSTGAVHAAAWAQPDGALAFAREDIGRHTALDKLIGARAARRPDGDGFCLVTSRCSYEMVQKASVAGISLLVCISAPTSLAIAEAERAGLALVALARADSQTVYVGQDRLIPRSGAAEAHR